MVQDGRNMPLVETPVQSSQSPQRQLGDCSVPTYQESPFNLCATKLAEEPGRKHRAGHWSEVYIEHQSILRRAVRDETKGPDVYRRDLNHPPTAVGGIRSKQ